LDRRSAPRCLTGNRALADTAGIQGSRCRLEPLTLAHASDLFAAHQLAPDARSWTWLLREPETSLAEFSAWVEQVATLADPIHFAVVDQQRGTRSARWR
jgi:hypothetical protein